MSPIEIALIVFAVVFGSSIVGLFVRHSLPPHHLSQESKDVVKLGSGLIGTLAALVLSLLISSAKDSFDTMNSELVQNAARAISLDRMLADYGPETKDLRDQLKRLYAARIEILFPSDKSQKGKMDTAAAVEQTEGFRSKLWALAPASEEEQWLRSRSVEIADEMAATRWLLLMQKDQQVPMTLVVIVVAWLAIIFAAFGLFAPRNATVVAALFVCSLSVAGAILLILEMSSPFAGVMKLSSLPMHHALADLGR